MSLLDEARALLGPAHVLTGEDAAPYGRDYTGMYPATPMAVVRPGSTAEVSALMKLAHASGTAVVPIGGNTGLTGATHAPDRLMISLERLNRIRAIRTDTRLAIVEAGVILQKLHEAVAEHGLRYPMTFGARGACQIGGNLSTNAGGSNVLRFGNTRALCLGIEAVLADGEVVDLMSELHKDNSGYDLRDLFIGAEGTLGIITAAVLKLVPAPRAHATAMVALPGLPQALTLLNRLQEETGGNVEAFEFMPRRYMERIAKFRPDLRPPLEGTPEVTVLVEIATTAPREAAAGPDGLPIIAETLQSVLVDELEAGRLLDAAVAQNDQQRQNMWAIREAAADVMLATKPVVDSDIAVPLDQIETFLSMVDVEMQKIDPQAEPVVVSHLGDGNLHFTICPTRNDPALSDQLREMVEDVTVKLRGSFSAEHGIGLTKLPSMRRRKDPVALRMMGEIKHALDPNGIMNPGKLLP